MTTTTTTNDIVALLDSSGSMGALHTEPMEALNGFISDQKSANAEGTFSLWTFNTLATNVIDDQPLSDVKPYTDYTPSGMTAICDAIGKAITMKLTKKNHKDVICLVVTDGLENASLEYKGSQIKRMISNMETKHNWKFIYIGANQDVFTVGAGLGMNRDNCASYSQEVGGLIRVTRQMSANVSAYRSTPSQEDRHLHLEILPERAESCPSRKSRNLHSNDSPSGLRPPPVVRQKTIRQVLLTPPPLVRQN